MLFGCLHKLKQVLVILLRGMAVYAYIIMNSNNVGEAVCCHGHLHLKYILGHLQTEWHAQEAVPAIMGIEHGQVGKFLIMVYAAEAVLSIQLAEAGYTTELMRDLIEGRDFIMLSHNGLVKILWVGAYAKCTIRFVGYIKDDTHSWETGAIIPLVTMSSRVCSICSQ